MKKMLCVTPKKNVCKVSLSPNSIFFHKLFECFPVICLHSTVLSTSTQSQLITAVTLSRSQGWHHYPQSFKPDDTVLPQGAACTSHFQVHVHFIMDSKSLPKLKKQLVWAAHPSGHTFLLWLPLQTDSFWSTYTLREWRICHISYLNNVFILSLVLPCTSSCWIRTVCLGGR